MSKQKSYNRYKYTKYGAQNLLLPSFALSFAAIGGLYCCSGSENESGGAGLGFSDQESAMAGQGSTASGGDNAATGGQITAGSGSGNDVGDGANAGNGASTAGSGGIDRSTAEESGGDASTAGKDGGDVSTAGEKGDDGGGGASETTADSGSDANSDTETSFGNVNEEDLGNNGPYSSTSTINIGPNNNYTVYHPQQLGPEGLKHPVIAWTSGGTTSHIMYPMLPHLATHGFVVISANTIPLPGAQIALGQEMVAGIDWLLEENERSDSQFFGKLDATEVAAMGYSMGGLATTTIVGDPRLTTTVHISGGTGTQGGIEKYDEMHAPAAFLCGGATGDPLVDIAGENCKIDFDYITTQSVFYGKFNGDHLCSLLPPCQDWLEVVATGWLRWQMMNDLPLKAMFVGSDCSICEDANWTVQQKNLL